MGPTPAPAASHRVPLERTTWSVWRDVCLRSAGFPADMVLAICDEPLARSADQAATDQDGAGPDGADPVRRTEGARPTYDLAYPDAAMRLHRAIAGIAADPGFQEALTWQNPVLAQLLHDIGVGPGRRTKERQRELTIANYLQRYCLKNDSIGFFGPVGWASADPGTAGLVVIPGQQLLVRRTTYFEVWAIDKVAAAIAGQGRVTGWLRPRRTRSTFLAGNVLHRAHRKPVVLADAELRILLACDGNTTIDEVLANTGEPNARALLTRLAELGALRLDLEGGMQARPENLLRDRLGQIADPAARAAALEPVERMVRARDAVAATAGDAAALRQALTDLGAAFEEITGLPATRRAGELYAGRTLVYQDTVRDVRITVGAAVTDAMARPLGLVLDSVRWLVNEITAGYRVLFAELLDRELARAGSASVPLQRLLTVASPHLGAHAGSRTLSEIAAASTAEFQRRWQVVLGPPSSPCRHEVGADAISATVAECFPAHPVAWSGARQHSPDIMIAAAAPGDVERGDFLLVLGELHVACNTLDGRLFVEQHPDPAALIAAEQADHGRRRIVSIAAKDFPAVTSRTSPPSATLGPGEVYWSSAEIDSLDPPDPATVMPVAAMSVSRRGDDLVVQVLPSGTELDFFEVIADMMGGVVTNAFQPVAPAPHQPRVTIDRLVLSREQWVFDVADSGWAFVKDEQERYYRARRWRRGHDLPERVFLRVPVEAKPVAVDFRSIVLVNLFARHVRHTQEAGHGQYSVSEMLPDLGQLWLCDHAGRRYSSELRFVAFDGLDEE
jgi:lantibiotic biosynthesis dehydratase-like protein